MKILQVFESYPLFYQPYIPPTLEALKLQKDIEIKIVAFKGKTSSPNIKILPSYSQRRVLEHLLLTTRIQKRKLSYLEMYAIQQKADIIHLQHSFLFENILQMLSYNIDKRPKVIVTLRGADTYVNPWVNYKWKNFYAMHGNKIDAFITMSEDQKNYLMRWGVSHERIQVIPISFGHPFTVAPRKPNKDKLKILSVFRMCWEKNITDNLRLIKHLTDTGIDVHYDIYGDGPDLGQVYYLINKYNLHDTAQVHGKVENSTLKEKLKAYDFILQLSHSESLGMSVIEAQSQGIPAIISDTDGLKEVVINDKTGFILSDNFDFATTSNLIVNLWQNEESYYTMSSNAIEFAQQNFNVETEVRKLMNLYTKLIS